MITLHGFSFSNYYNIIKHVLLHKDLPFKEDLQYGDDDAYLALSPVGKVPAMTTEDGHHISESSVCCDYLEEAYADRAPLYPLDPIARAKVRQVMKVAELYLELSCRRTIPFAFTNTEVPEPVKREIKEVAERGIKAMNSLCNFAPYVLGNEMTMADIYLRYVFRVVAVGSEKIGWDIIADIDGAHRWAAMMADNDISRRIDADEEAEAPAFLAHLKARYDF